MFFVNVCKFNCGKTFASLGELIYHIEETHIDYDPATIELKEQSQPACLPLSYVLRFITDAARTQKAAQAQQQMQAAAVAAPSGLGGSSNVIVAGIAGNGAPGGGAGAATCGVGSSGVGSLGGSGGTSSSVAGGGGGVEMKRKNAIKHHSYSLSSSNRSTTPTGSEMDDDELMVSESEDSNDSWTTEEFSSEFIMRYGVKNSATNGLTNNEKPYVCPVPGCKKRYKNVNGIKYHSKNGHKKDGKVRKGYKCHCGKSYKTAQGLKHHAMLANHNTTPAEGQANSQAAAAAAAAVANNGNSNNSSPASATTSTIVGIATTAPLKSTLGLVTIKTKPSFVGITTGSKLVKLVAEKPAASAGPAADKSVAGVPGLVAAAGTKIDSFGLLTPATSPKQAAQQAQLLQAAATGATLDAAAGSLTFITPSSSSVATSSNTDTDTESELSGVTARTVGDET